MSMLDREGPVPVYQQIAQIIHDRITNGELLAGERVPSEAALESEFQIARTTARRVARELRQRGIAHTIQGEGTFVGEPGVPRVAREAPLYLKIAEVVAERIHKGEISPNRAIPGEKVLMREHGAAKATVRAAVAHLRECGWVFTVPYRGTYVNDPSDWPASQSSRPGRPTD